MARQEVTCDNIKRLQTPVYANENNFEHALMYHRPDGSRVEMALIHVPGQEPTFATAIYSGDTNPNETPIPSALLELSMDELLVRFHYVQHLKEAGLLDR